MEERAMTTSRTLSAIVFLFGVWLIVSPYIFGYDAAQAIWQQTIAGVIVAVVAAVRYMMPNLSGLSWINVIVGAWMIIAPFATNYSTGVAYWNEVIFGALILIGSAWNASIGEEAHRGHPAR